jgi:hypothetical protein
MAGDVFDRGMNGSNVEGAGVWLHPRSLYVARVPGA